MQGRIQVMALAFELPAVEPNYSVIRVLDQNWYDCDLLRSGIARPSWLHNRFGALD
jgi:hypothetical protein